MNRGIKKKFFAILVFSFILLSFGFVRAENDIFLEAFGTDQELHDESYVWYRGEDPLSIIGGNQFPLICDNQGVFGYWRRIRTGTDTYWHFEGDLTVESTAAVRSGKLYVRNYVRDGRPEGAYFHGTNDVSMIKTINIEGPISGLNHLSRLSMDLELINAARGGGYAGGAIEIGLSFPEGQWSGSSLLLGEWHLALGGEGGLIPTQGWGLQTFESFDIKLSDFMGWSDEEFDERFADEWWIGFYIQVRGGIAAGWDNWESHWALLECAIDNIHIYREQNQRPVASFTYSPQDPHVNQEITFDASSSYDPDGEIVRYSWDFGDGNTAEGEVVTHAYTGAGEYTVTLTVTDNEGLNSSEEKSVVITVGTPLWRQDLQVGDIVVCRSASPIAISGFYTHAGIYVGNNQVVEAKPKEGVKCHNITEWDHPNKTWVQIFRVKGLTEYEQNLLVDWVESQVDRGYDYDLTRKAIFEGHPSQGYGYGYGTDKWYCSELVWAAYLKIGYILEESPDEGFVSPQEIADDDDVIPINGHYEYCPLDILGLLVRSPVHVVVTDPDGLIVGLQSNEIPGAYYILDDIDEDGDLDDLVGFSERKLGEYLVEVIPKPDALLSDTYNLEVIANDTTITLAKDVQVSDIPSQPYIFESTETLIRLKGDINGDGQVNVLDVQACVNVVLGRETDPEIIQRAKAMAEPYDECNVLDVQTIVNIILGGLEPIPGDLDGDGDVDRDDLNIILSYRNQPATEYPRCDLDDDGMITALDARKLVLLCTRPRCACE